eukprot:sb/3464327/
MSVNKRISDLKSGDEFCSFCFTQVDNWDAHCETSDHVLYRDAVLECTPVTQEPVKEVFDHKNLVSLKPGSTQERLTKQGCIGLAKIEYYAPSNSWLCGHCLETFNHGIDLHASTSGHIIQSIKSHDVVSAFELKQLEAKGSSRELRKRLREKAQEVFEKEKEDPDVLRFLLTLSSKKEIFRNIIKPEVEILAPMVPIKPKAAVVPAKKKITVGAKKKKTAAKKDIVVPADEEEELLSKTLSPEPPALMSVASSQDFPSIEPDIPDGIVLFEEEDRTLLPVVQESTKPAETAAVTPTVSRPNAKKAEYSLLLTGVKYIEWKNNKYHCTLCDIPLTKRLSFSKTHMTASLHRRKVVTGSYSDPVPPYLEELRAKDSQLYSNLLNKECRLIEKKERDNESDENQKKRAGILGLKLDELPFPLANVVPLTAEQEKLDLRELAEKWYCAKNKIKITSPKPSTSKFLFPFGISTLKQSGEY